MSEPKIGDIKRRLFPNGQLRKVIYNVCEECGKGRWQLYYKNKVAHPVCKSCSVKKRDIYKFVYSRLGVKYSEELKTRISESRKKYLQTENGIRDIENIRKRMTGRNVSQETKDKISLVNKGNTKKRGSKLTSEQRNNISQGKLKYFKSKEGIKTRENMKNRLKGRISLFAGKHHTIESKNKLSISRSGKKHTEESKVLMSVKVKERWKDKRYKDRHIKSLMRSMNIKPNKPEQLLMLILDDIDGEWRYVGDGSLIIGGRNPDFWNGKDKLIEHFGDYWHSDERVRCYEETEEGRIKHFSEYGYDTLVIWQSELSNVSMVISKIECFVSS